MSDEAHDKINVPKSTKWDLIYKIGKGTAAVAGGLAGVPGASALASELYSTVIRPPLTKRTDEFMAAVAEKLIFLEEKIDGFKVEALKDNPLFISIILEAIQISLRNHQKEKIEALQNAVLNSALPSKTDESKQMIFLHYINIFTPDHFLLLGLLDNPRDFMNKVNRVYPTNIILTSLKDMIEYVMPSLAKDFDYFRAIFGDLYTHGLINTENNQIGAMMSHSDSGILANRTTSLGKAFLRFISPPTIP